MKTKKETGPTKEDDLKELRTFYISEPTIQYKIGDRVKRGNIKQTIIIDIIDNGKIYKVHEIVTEHNYGRSYDFERDEYVVWHDLLPYKEEQPTGSFIQNKDLEIRYSQRDVSSLLLTSYHAGIDTETDYQRGNVWELSDKVKLIDSIFKHVDIGKFSLIRRPWDHKGFPR